MQGFVDPLQYGFGTMLLQQRKQVSFFFPDMVFKGSSQSIHDILQPVCFIP
jgi:hypothetical protein